jgi:hypothetical protein
MRYKVKIDQSTYLLILANSIPLFGVIFFGWNLFSILVLYWSENLVIGFYNIFRIMLAEGKSPRKIPSKNTQGASKFFLVPFFIVHYGGFTLGHGVFVFALFGSMVLGPNLGLNLSGILFGVLGLFISHGFSFFDNFLGKKEYLQISPQSAFISPYGRIVVMHLTILFGAFLVVIFRAPIMVLVLLIVLKIGLDIGAHQKEHLKFREANEI